jgi:lipid-A-disaccharide synthase
MTGRYPSETGITDFIAADDSSGVDLSLTMFPELLQHEATPDALAENLLAELYRAERDDEYLSRFEALHASLRQGANERAADAVLAWLGEGKP